jgi:hypothetical protein
MSKQPITHENYFESNLTPDQFGKFAEALQKGDPTAFKLNDALFFADPDTADHFLVTRQIMETYKTYDQESNEHYSNVSNMIHQWAETKEFQAQMGLDN